MHGTASGTGILWERLQPRFPVGIELLDKSRLKPLPQNSPPCRRGSRLNDAAEVFYDTLFRHDRTVSIHHRA